MRNYDVYFEIFGKKMKTRVLAKNEIEAKESIKNAIKYHKVVMPNEYFNEAMDNLDIIGDFFKNRKQ